MQRKRSRVNLGALASDAPLVSKQRGTVWGYWRARHVGVPPKY